MVVAVAAEVAALTPAFFRTAVAAVVAAAVAFVVDEAQTFSPAAVVAGAVVLAPAFSQTAVAAVVAAVAVVAGGGQPFFPAVAVAGNYSHCFLPSAHGKDC